MPDSESDSSSLSLTSMICKQWDRTEMDRRGGRGVKVSDSQAINLHFSWRRGRAGLNASLGSLPTAHCYPGHGGSHCCAPSLSLTTSVNKDLNNKQRNASLCVTVSFTGLRFSPCTGHLNDSVKGSVQWSANFFSLASLDGTVVDK